MSRKLQTIYEYFSDYSEKEIEDVIFNYLSLEEKVLLRARYGDDLHNPVTLDTWNYEKSSRFYSVLIPKIKKLLKEHKKEEVVTEEVKHEEVIEKKENVQLLQPVVMLSEVIELINSGKTNKEICDELHIETQQLYSLLLSLKNRGLMFFKKYYSDGSIKYKQAHSIIDFKNLKSFNQDRTIITDPKENRMKFLVISDLHYGSSLERLDLIDRAYNYCIKHGINIILCGGDIIDGAFNQTEQKISDIFKQVEYFITNYPYDKNILNFAVAGDHDMSALRKAGINIIDMCDNYRPDFVIGGFNNTGINIKNDQILLYHHVDTGNMRRTGAPIILHGHSHKFATDLNRTTLNVTIPTLSDITQSIPSVLELEVGFNKGYLSDAIVRNISFEDSRDVLLSESIYDLSLIRNITGGEIRNVEDYRKEANSEATEEEILNVKKLERVL